MTARSTGVAVAVALALAAAGAAAGPRTRAELFAQQWGEGLEWEAQPVRAAVAPHEVRGAAPFVPESAPELRGTVEVGPGKAAAFWLGSLDVVRVRAGAPLRFERVRAEDAPEPGAASTVRIAEDGIPAKDGVVYLAEPMGGGSSWVVTAERPTRVTVERPARRAMPWRGEALRGELLDWIDGNGRLPPMPYEQALRAQLERDAAIAEAVRAGREEDAALAEAVRAWRRASALQAWTTAQPLTGPTARLDWLKPPGKKVTLPGAEVPHARLPAEGEWKVDVHGPGVLALEWRAAVRADDVAPRRLTVMEGDRVLGTLDVRPQAATERTDDHAFPAPAPEVVVDAQTRAGLEELARLPLATGRHALTLRWSGGEALLRARVVERRPWLSEVFRRESLWEEHARAAVGAAKKVKDGRGRIVEALTAALRGQSLPVPLDPRLPAPVQAVIASLDATGSDAALRREALQTARALLTGQKLPEGVLAWHLRLVAARAMIADGAASGAERLLESATAFPARGWLAMEAAQVLALLPDGEPLRSRELAALELAWRMDPLAEALRGRYRQAFWRAARWQVVPPAPRGAVPAELARRWLDVEPASADSPGAGALWRVGEQAPLVLRAEGSATRPVLLQGYLVAAGAGPKVATLTLGDRRYPVMATGAAEPVQLALPPGEHRLALEGAAGAQLYLRATDPRVTAADASTGAERAYLRLHWPVRTEEGAVRFPVPEPRLTSPVRVQLRATGALDRPVTVWMHTDVGPAQRLVLEPGAASARQLSLDEPAGPQPSSAAADAVLLLPPLAREVWFETEPKDAPVVASLAVRRALSTPAEVAPMARGELPADPVREVLALSRRLATEPHSVDALFARARLLVDLDETGAAADDALRLLALRPQLNAAQAQELVQLLERISVDRLDASFVQPVSGPVLLSPAAHALPGADAAALQRAVSVQDGGAQDPLARYVRARLAAAAGRPAEAARALARLYRETDRPELGLEALEQLGRSEGTEGWREYGALLGVGLASELSGWAELPVIRRVGVEARRWTRWQSIRDTETTVGRFDAVDPDGRGDRAAAIRKALLAPPWELRETRVVTRGGTTMLELPSDGPGRVALEARCTGRQPSALDANADCRFALRVDGATAGEHTVRAGQDAVLEAEVSGGGRHQVEVELTHAGAGAVGLVRFTGVDATGMAQALVGGAPVSLVRARPGAPARVIVQGPATVRIEARALRPSAPGTLRVSAVDAVTEGAKPRVRALPLAADVDGAVLGAAAPIGLPSEQVLSLPDDGPHALTFEPDSGEALVRVELAVLDAPTERVSTLDWEPATGQDRLPWPASPDRLSLLPEGTGPLAGARALGTLSTELAYRGEDLEEDEPLARSFRSGGELAVSYRHALLERRLWVRVTPELRWPLASAPVTGGSAALYARELPLGLRFFVAGGGHTQALSGTRRWAVRGTAAADRWFSLTPDLGLVPRLRVSAERFGGGEFDALEFDRRVYSRYGKNHPWRWGPKLTLRWQPVLDHFLALDASATSNADGVTVDNAAGQLRWGGLLWDLVPGLRGGAGYELSQRFADQHRRDGYLRHTGEARLEWIAWSGHAGRFLLFAQDTLMFSSRYGLQNVVSTGVRWDWTGGRGLRDVMPFEEEFEPLLDPDGAGR